jgi:hypothetical protein
MLLDILIIIIFKKVNGHVRDQAIAYLRKLKQPKTAQIL